MLIFEEKPKPKSKPRTNPASATQPVPVAAPTPPVSTTLPETKSVKPSFVGSIVRLFSKVHFKVIQVLGTLGFIATSAAKTAATACRPALTNPYLMAAGIALLVIAAIVVASKLIANL